MSDTFPVIIFHNPACGTSRNVVAMVEAAGYRPEVVEYLKAGWSVAQLETLFAEAGITPREALRTKGALAGDLGLLEPGKPDAVLLAAMVEHPVLVERPIVQTSKGTALCRPSEKVFDLLDQRPGSFVKEDGQIV